jgi:hypothetical protein
VEPYNKDFVKVLYGFKEEHYRWDREYLITKATMSHPQIHLTVFVKIKKFSPQILYILGELVRTIVVRKASPMNWSY